MLTLSGHTALVLKINCSYEFCVESVESHKYTTFSFFVLNCEGGGNVGVSMNYKLQCQNVGFVVTALWREIRYTSCHSDLNLHHNSVTEQTHMSV
jgi:hypothetical protein